MSKNDEFIRVRLPANRKAHYTATAANAGFLRKSKGEDVGDVSKWIRAVLDDQIDSNARVVELAADRERLAYWLCVLMDEFGERQPTEARKRVAVALLDMNFGEPGSPRARAFVNLGEPGRRRG